MKPYSFTCYLLTCGFFLTCDCLHLLWGGKNHDVSAQPSGLASCFLVAFAVPLWLRCSHQGPDWTRSTLHTWYLSSVAALVLPYVAALCQGWQELTTLSMIQRMVNAPPRYPSLVTCTWPWWDNGDVKRTGVNSN